MTRIYADGVLVYDSRVNDYDLVGLTVTTALNKGGTAELRMPPKHPTYSTFIPYRTIVEIYRDDELRFRGRALYHTEELTGTRTVTCEGELCFLQDVVRDAYSVTTTPRKLFEHALTLYGAAVESFKLLAPGEVTVGNADNEMLFESEEAETVLDTVTKLLDVCGGYLVFTTDSSGTRRVNWRASAGNDARQTIDAENLLDLGSTSANTELCTVVVPYGAKDADTGRRLDITSANGGRDHLKDEAAVTAVGTIQKVVVWDEVTDPQVLKSLGQQYLDEHKHVVQSLTVTALDLSYIDKSIDAFRLGDLIRVVSRPHGLDERFQLVELTEDLLNPAQSTVTLGKEVLTLTGLDVAGDANAQRGLLRAVSQVRSGYTAAASQAATELATRLDPVIQNIQNRLNILELPTDDGVDNV